MNEPTSALKATFSSLRRMVVVEICEKGAVIWSPGGVQVHPSTLRWNKLQPLKEGPSLPVIPPCLPITRSKYKEGCNKGTPSQPNSSNKEGNPVPPSR
ncbi:hypothetical protein Q8A73_001518 [Channa argus]|nr:hypothetical protein Q8A73_001518 [Channa argus]